MPEPPTPTARSPQPPPQGYVERINRAIDYVLAHLDEPLPLETVAAAAHFSPFHFHRIFKGLVGETLSHFVKRLRLERAMRMLSHDRSRSLTEVALSCGFSSSSDFSRCFKQRYGLPPSAFDIDGFRKCQREEWQRAIAEPGSRDLLGGLPPGENPDGFAVTLRDLPVREVAYIRVLAPYRPDAVSGAAERLVQWAEPRDLADGQWLGYMWDDPDVVAHEQCRYDVAVELPSDPSRCPFADRHGSGEVGRLSFPPMTVAEVELRGGIDLEMRALDWLFLTWLPGSRFAPTDQPSFEAWMGLPFAHGFEHFELKVHIPVQPLAR